MSQAIETYIIPATNNKCTRIKARCERGSIIMSPPIHDKAWSSEENHIAVAKKLCAKFAQEDAKQYGSNIQRNPWSGHFVTGGTKRGYAHVFIDGSAS